MGSIVSRKLFLYLYDPGNYWVYEFSIKDSNVILLKNVDDVNYFTNEYKNDFGINWSKVYEKYDGIGILNYNETKTNLYKNNLVSDYIWYHTIDINSYCIWNTSILEQINCEKINKNNELIYYNCD